MENSGLPHNDLRENINTLKSAIPPLFDQVRNRFDLLGISETTHNELLALLDIDFLLSYWSNRHYEQNKEVMLSDLRIGKSAQEVHHILFYSLNPNHLVMDDRYKNPYRSK